MSARTARWASVAIFFVGAGTMLAAGPSSARSPLAVVLRDYAAASQFGACDERAWLDRMLAAIDESPDDPLRPAALEAAYGLASRLGDTDLAGDLAVRLIHTATNDIEQCQYHELLADALDQGIQAARPGAASQAARSRALQERMAVFEEAVGLLARPCSADQREILSGIVYTAARELAEVFPKQPNGTAKALDLLKRGRTILVRHAPEAGFDAMGISYAEALAFAELEMVLRQPVASERAVEDILKSIANLKRRMMSPSEYLRYAMSTRSGVRLEHLAGMWLALMPPDEGTALLKVEYARRIMRLGRESAGKAAALLECVHRNERPQLARLATVVAARNDSFGKPREQAAALKAKYEGLLLQALVEAELLAGRPQRAQRYATELWSLYPASSYAEVVRKTLNHTRP